MKREIFELENMLIIYHIPSKQKRNITDRLARIKEQIWIQENLLTIYQAPTLYELEKEFQLK